MPANDSALLRKLAAARSELDAVIRDQVDLIRDPGPAGWEASAAAVVTLPLAGASAVLVGLAHLTVASTDEAEWDRMFSKANPPSAAPADAEPAAADPADADPA